MINFNFETFMLVSVALMFTAMFIFGIIYLVKKDDIKPPRNNNVINNNECYENGEITNVCTIVVLKNIKREFKRNLSQTELDAFDKAIANTIIAERLKTFIDDNEEC